MRSNPRFQRTVVACGNQGDAEGTRVLPEGVAAMLPGGIQVRHEIHYVNSFREEVDLSFTIALFDGVSGGGAR